MKRTTIAGFLVCLTALNSHGASPNGSGIEKKPWEWTVQERAAARRDPLKRIDRVADFRSASPTSHIAANNYTHLGDVIDGRRHPELYFPTELFEHLVRVAFAGGQEQWLRHEIVEHSPHFFHGDATWDRFGALVADYARILRQQQTAADAFDTASVSSIQQSKCSAEAKAFRAVRSAFGRQNVDAMLYQAVAPTLQSTFSLDTDFEKSIANAQAREERCQ